MKKTALVIALLVLLFPFLITKKLNAAENQTGNVVILDQKQEITSDYFAAGNSVTLSGTVDGDAYIAASNVYVDGMVNGDLLVLGGKVEVRGKVMHNIRALGGQINISGMVGGNVSAAGGSVSILKNAEIAGRLVSASGNLSVYAPIGKGATISAGQATIDNLIDGTLWAGVGKLDLMSNARINGDLNYWNNQKALKIQTGAQINGQTNYYSGYNQKDFISSSQIWQEVIRVYALFKTLSLFSALILGLILLKFFPRFSLSTRDLLSSTPGRSLILGLLFLLLIPVVIFLLLISILGIPLALVLILAYLVYIYVAKVFVGMWLGAKIVKDFNHLAKKSIFNQEKDRYWVFILGIIIYGLLITIPIIGEIIGFISIIAGLGALLLKKLEIYRELSRKEII